MTQPTRTTSPGPNARRPAGEPERLATAGAADEFVDAPQRGDARGVRVPHRPRGARVARREITRDLHHRGVDATTSSEASMVAAELLGNAVRHAGPLDDGTVLLRWHVRAGVVDLDVTDGGSPAPVHPRPHSSVATSGRGLRIVRDLAHEWGTYRDDEGRCTVWAALGGATHRRRTA